MKKFLISVLFVLALVLVVSPAFALDCSNGNYGSDQCFTDAQTVTNDGAIIAGTVMVYDFVTPTQQGNTADNAAYYVRQAASSDNGNIVAGVAQKNYASGDRVRLLVRGQGKLRVQAGRSGATSGAITSGDRIWVKGGANNTSDKGTAITESPLDTSRASKDGPIAFALTSSASSATIDAYITVIGIN